MIISNFKPETFWLTPPANERQSFDGSNEWFSFRSTWTVPTPSDLPLNLRIAADSKYDLYINGELVVREGGLKRGPTPEGSYYDEIDLSKHLVAGKNAVALLLWYFGRHGFSHRDSGQPGLLMEAQTGTLENWKVTRHPAFYDAGYIHDAYRLSENSVGYDARRELSGWMNASYDDSTWSEPETMGKAGDAPWGALEKREFPQWFWSEEQSYESVEEQSDDGGYTYYHCKLPHNTHLLPTIKIEARAGIRLKATAAQDTGRLESTYITKEGAQNHTFPGWINGEHVIYKVPSDAVKVISLGYIETGYPSEFIGSFECDNERLNLLWRKAQRTLYVTMRDNFMDCPCRERAQWPGDMVIQLAQVPYCLDREADLLIKKGLRETFRWQREDDVIYGPVPEGNWRMELPSQMLSVVSEYGVWTYFLNTGDSETLHTIYAAAKRYFDIWQFQPNGLIKYRPGAKGEQPKEIDGVSIGTWDWIDWGTQVDCEPALNAWFVLAAQGLKRLAAQLGKDADAKAIEAIENRLCTAIQESYWDDAKGGYVSKDFSFEPDDRVQALMVLNGVAPKTAYPQIRSIFQNVEQSCPYMEKYVLEALMVMGHMDDALDRMERRYSSMINNESTTLYELFPEQSDDPGTVNHSWSGGPLTLLSSWVAGVRPIEAGWKHFLIKPNLGQLQTLRTMTRVPQGDICLAIDLIDDVWQIDVSVPLGTTAEIDLTELNPTVDPYTIEAGKHSTSFENPIKVEVAN